MHGTVCTMHTPIPIMVLFVAGGCSLSVSYNVVFVSNPMRNKNVWPYRRLSDGLYCFVRLWVGRLHVESNVCVFSRRFTRDLDLNYIKCCVHFALLHSICIDQMHGQLNSISTLPALICLKPLTIISYAD